MNSNSTPVLAVDGLRQVFGQTTILDGLDLQVGQGELVCLVGPSGSGKTTLLRCLAGLQRATGGSVRFAGEQVEGPPHGLGVVFQDYGRSLLPWKRVADNIELPLKSAGWSRAERKARVQELLAAVGLEGKSHLFPRQMSGGMQQRVAIARALAIRPQLLLMDEPFGALDAQTRQELQDLVLQVRDDFDVTIIFVTHDIDESVYLADRVAVLTKVPATFRDVVDISLPRPRDQFSTTSHPEFAPLRNHVLAQVRGVDVPGRPTTVGRPGPATASSP